MPKLRPPTWSAVQSFPSPDGSRTLRVGIPTDVVEAMRSRELKGIRQSFIWEMIRGRRQLVTESEVLTKKWIKQDEWFQSFRAVEAIANYSSALPRILLDHLRCGRLRAVTQNLSADTRELDGIRSEIIVEVADGQKETAKAYLSKQSASVEMCVPLSAEEADAFFDDNGGLMGVRHAFIIYENKESLHTVDVLSLDGEWRQLDTTEVFVWDKVVKPHFRFTFTEKKSSIRKTINSSDPWIE